MIGSCVIAYVLSFDPAVSSLQMNRSVLQCCIGKRLLFVNTVDLRPDTVSMQTNIYYMKIGWKWVDGLKLSVSKISTLCHIT